MTQPPTSSDAAADLSPEAIDRWRRRIRQTTFANYHLEMGIAIEAEGNLAAAGDAYRRALAEQPDLVPASDRLIDLLRRAGDEAAAAAEAGRSGAGTEAFKAAAILHRIGVAQRTADWAEAKRLAAAVAGMHAADPRAVDEEVSRLGRALWQCGRTDDAALVLRAVMESSPTAVECGLVLGYMLVTLDRLEEARAALEYCVGAETASPDAYYVAGYIAMSLGRLDEATARIERALALNYPRYASTARMLAWCHQLQGRYDAALSVFEEAIRREPADPGLVAYQALCLQAAGRLPEALALHQRVDMERERLPDSLTNAAVALAANGDVDRALALHGRALEIGAQNAVLGRFWHLLATAGTLVRAGRRSEAVDHCRQAVAEKNSFAAMSIGLLPEGRKLLGDLWREAGGPA